MGGIGAEEPLWRYSHCQQKMLDTSLLIDVDLVITMDVGIIGESVAWLMEAVRDKIKWLLRLCPDY